MTKEIRFKKELALKIRNQQKTVTRRPIKGDLLELLLFFVGVDKEHLQTFGELPVTDSLGQNFKDGLERIWTAEYPDEGGADFNCPYGKAGEEIKAVSDIGDDIPLLIKSVRIERIQDMTEEDAVLEGCTAVPCDHARYLCAEIGCCGPTALGWFKHIWTGIYKEQYPWQSNPWVWVIEFEVVGG